MYETNWIFALKYNQLYIVPFKNFVRENSKFLQIQFNDYLVLNFIARQYVNLQKLLRTMYDLGLTIKHPTYGVALPRNTT